jgi:hypothetical protein
VSDAIENNGGRLGGAKTFRYLVIPDSARTASLPALVYRYFDPATEEYTQALAPAVTYVVAPANESAVSRATPAALMLTTSVAPVTRVVQSIPRGGRIALVLLPPLLALAMALPRKRRPRATPAKASRSDPMAIAEREFSDALARLGPHVMELEGDRLEQALRSAGIEAHLARAVRGARDRVRAARYGPDGSGNRQEILGELRKLTEQLRGSGVGDRSVSRVAITLMLVCGLSTVVSQAQTLPPEQLYMRGALSSAALGFAERAAAEPNVAAHWFNLGATRFRMGAAGSALAAWARAERLAPRNPAIRRALRLVPPPDSRSARALWVPPVTPDELWIIAGFLWAIGWVGYAFDRRRRWSVVIIGALLVAGGAGGLTGWYQRALGVVTAEHSLAISPHELAPAVVPVQVGSVVTVLSRDRGWAMVRESGGKVGWLPLEDLEEL